jgi:hypothetical protein
MKKMTFHPAIFLFLSLFFLLQSVAAAQEPPKKLTEFWEIGDEYKYEIKTWNKILGYSSGQFVGMVKHAAVGESFLFRTLTTINDLSGNLVTSIKGEVFTQGSGYPGFYTAEYTEKGQTRKLKGALAGYDFNFIETMDSMESEFKVNISPSTQICDRQTIPHWNLIFFNAPDLERDTIVFSVLIPYLKTRAKMRMIRQPDEKIKVMGKDVACKVFFSIRTDEYYYITPERIVARVHLPKQSLYYDLVAIEKKPTEVKKPEE